MADTNYANAEVFLMQLQDNEVAQQYQDEAVFMNSVVDKKPGQWVNQKGYMVFGIPQSLSHCSGL